MNLKFEHINKCYEGKTILKDLNLVIKDVGVVGIIGESGCGKSTLLRQLIGIEFPDSGNLQINDENINEDTVKDFQLRIGVVFQKHNLFPHLTVKKNIMLILTKVKKMTKEEASKRTDEILEELHLTPQANQIPRKISGGQAQRASIARALSTKPELLFLDEPTAALDPLLTKEVLSSIKELKDSGIEFVFVTHEMDFLRKFADVFIFMDEGEIIESGPIEQLEKPLTEKLAKFVTRE